MNSCPPRLPKLGWLGKTTLNAMIRSDVPQTFAIRGATLEGCTATRLATKGRLCRDNFSNGASGTREIKPICRQPRELELPEMSCGDSSALSAQILVAGTWLRGAGICISKGSLHDTRARNWRRWIYRQPHVQGFAQRRVLAGELRRPLSRQCRGGQVGRTGDRRYRRW